MVSPGFHAYIPPEREPPRLGIISLKGDFRVEVNNIFDIKNPWCTQLKPENSHNFLMLDKA